jgi:hypothetical protein
MQNEKTIPLTKGKVALVDVGDYEALGVHKWCVNGNGYAVRSISVGGKTKVLRMHRVITGTPAGTYVDHINGDKLDNRRSNLRFATQQQNNCNKQRRRDNAAGFKGVYLVKRRGKFVAEINVLGRRIFLGRFSAADAAARAYDVAALKHHGEFARLNFRDGAS